MSLFAILALVFLAAGLRGINFKEPRSFNRAESEQVSASVAAFLEELASIPRWKQVLFWVCVYLLVLIVASFLSPELRKQLLWGFFRLAILSLVIMYLIQNREQLGITLPETLKMEQSQVMLEFDEPPVFSPPSLPPALSYAISVAVVLLAVGLFWLVGRRVAALRRHAGDLSLEDIADAARSSLRDLSAGGDWEDSILQCYARMMEVVARTRGFQRDPYLTPSEFAYRLEQSGLPAQAVRRLTRLFESVRYGARTSDVRERDEAASCLTDILHHCGETA